MNLPMPGPGRPHHPGQVLEPPSQRQLERARQAKERGKPRRFDQLLLHRAARKGGR
jgi:hypothetical protein